MLLKWSKRPQKGLSSLKKKKEDKLSNMQSEKAHFSLGAALGKLHKTHMPSLILAHLLHCMKT